VYDYKGTFGVVISDVDKPIAQNLGTLYSPECYETSHRSEIYAMLAGVVSLSALVDTLDTPMSNRKQIVFHSNNLPIIKRLNL
jgi:hypothetical protein